MPFTSTDVTFTVAFQYTNAERKTGVVRLTYSPAMLTALTSNGISLSNVTGAFDMIGPDGMTAHSGNISVPDFTAGQSVSIPVNLPVTASAFPTVQQGNYGFTLTVRIAPPTDAGDYVSDSLEVEFCPGDLVLDQDIEIDCGCATISSTDGTDYETGGWTVTSRAMRMDPPPPQNLTHAPVTSATTVVSNSGQALYIGTYTFTLTVTATNDLGGATVEITLVDVVSQQVICVDLCKMGCGLNKVLDNLDYAFSVSDYQGITRWKGAFAMATDIYQLAKVNINCAPERVNALTERFWKETTLGSSCSCCTDNTPSAVVPTCGSSGGGGSEYTFAVSVQASVFFTLAEVAGVVTLDLTTKGNGILNAVKNYDITSTGGTVTVTNSTSAAVVPTKTYNVEVAAGSLPLNSYEVLATLNTATGVWSFLTPTTKGSLFVTGNPTITLQGDGYNWIVSGFLVGGATKIYPVVTLEGYNRVSGGYPGYEYITVCMGEYGALTASESVFGFRFIGSPFPSARSLSQLQTVANTIQLLLKIEA